MLRENILLLSSLRFENSKRNPWNLLASFLSCRCCGSTSCLFGLRDLSRVIVRIIVVVVWLLRGNSRNQYVVTSPRQVLLVCLYSLALIISRNKTRLSILYLSSLCSFSACYRHCLQFSDQPNAHECCSI